MYTKTLFVFLPLFLFPCARAADQAAKLNNMGPLAKTIFEMKREKDESAFKKYLQLHATLENPCCVSYTYNNTVNKFQCKMFPKESIAL